VVFLLGYYIPFPWDEQQRVQIFGLHVSFHESSDLLRKFGAVHQSLCFRAQIGASPIKIETADGAYYEFASFRNGFLCQIQGCNWAFKLI